MQLEHSFSVPVPVDVAWQALSDPGQVAPCFPGATLTSVEADHFTGNVKVKMGPVSLLYKGTGRFTTMDEQARRLVLEATGKDARGAGTASATITATLRPAGTPGPGPGKGDATSVDVLTDLTITGRPAQLGRGLINEVSGKLLDAFAGCLASQLSAGQAGAGAGTAEAGAGAVRAGAGAAQAGGVESAAATEPAGAPSTSVGLSPEPVRSSLDGPPTRSSEPTPPTPPTPPAAVRPVGSADEIDLLDLAGQPVLKRLIPVALGLLAMLVLLRWLRRRA